MSRGSPRLPENDGHRCQAVTIETEWKRRNKTDLRCPFFARLEINGKRLCNKHAEIEAVATLINLGKARRIMMPAQRAPYEAVRTVKSTPG
jgi:hypothetical protein